MLVNGHYVTDANDIAKVFNEYFTQVGKSLSDKLPVPKFYFSKYMSDSNPYSMFLSPVTEDELLKEINKLNNKKSTASLTYPPKSLNHASTTLSLNI